MIHQLETQRLILRNYQENDWEQVHEYGSIPEFSQFETWGPNTEDETKKFVHIMTKQACAPDRFVFDFAVCLREGGRLIGGCGIRRESQTSNIAYLGWAINPKFQNNGYATESASRLIEFGFDELKLKVIYATCDSRNTASFKVMEKLGMCQVGHLIGHKMQKGFLRNTYRYELVKL